MPITNDHIDSFIYLLSSSRFRGIEGNKRKRNMLLRQFPYMSYHYHSIFNHEFMSVAKYKSAQQNIGVFLQKKQVRNIVVLSILRSPAAGGCRVQTTSQNN